MEINESEESVNEDDSTVNYIDGAVREENNYFMY
jgi:hypothetical protein